jgi:hypothetical protein
MVERHHAYILRRRRNLSRTWAGMVVTWSLIRALIVWAAVGDYGLNPWIYLVIDLACASVDAVTTPRMVIAFIDDEYRRAAWWAVASLVAFLLPDVYIFTGSRTLPRNLILIIVGIVSTTLTIGVIGIVRKVRKGRRLRAELARRSAAAGAHA